MLNNVKFISRFFAIIAIVFAVGCEDDPFAHVTIDSVESNNFYPGEDVILTGNNFDTVLFVFLEKDNIPFQLNGNQITFTLPESQAIGNTLATLVMAKGYIVTTNIEVFPKPQPIIHTVSPSSADRGEQVTIVGTSLDNLQSVTIGGTTASVVSSSFDEVVVTVPTGIAQNGQAELKLTTIYGVASPPVPFYVGKNLLLNGGLELGGGDDFTNWGKWNGGGGMTATSADGEAYVGRSLRVLAVGGDAWRSQFVSDPATTTVGSQYTLFMLIKAQPGTPGDGGSVRFSTNPNALYSGNSSVTTQWKLINWTFTANSDQTRAVLDLGATANAVYFVDNITLIKL